jgi:hypothetical protein
MAHINKQLRVTSRVRYLIAWIAAGLLLSLLTAPSRLQAQGDALSWDFENGDLQGWTTSGQVTLIGPTADLQTDNALSTAAQGKYAVRVGDEIPWGQQGDQSSSLERTVQIPSVAKPVLQFSYAVVANDPPNHPETDKPLFELKVRDLTSNEDLPVSDFKYSSQTSKDWYLGHAPDGRSFGQTSQSWLLGDRWVFIPWRHETVDLAGRAGHQLLIHFMVRDCNPAAHAAYGYFDTIHVGDPVAAPALPALLKPAQPAGDPGAPGVLAAVPNAIEQYSLWPWCLLLPLLLLALLAFWLFRRGQVTRAGDTELRSPGPRPIPNPPLQSPGKTNSGQATKKD